MGGSRAAALAGEPPPVMEQQDRLKMLAENLLREFGPAIVEALLTDTVTDVERNPDGRVWVKDTAKGEPYEIVGDRRIDDWAAMNIVGMIASLANEGRGEINSDIPHLEATIPEITPGMPGAGCRFTATVPPMAPKPMFAIRKPAKTSRTLTDYLEDRLITRIQLQTLHDLVADRANFLIVGETGSGKTTFGKAVLREMSEIAGPDERFAILEDTPELVCTAPNHYHLYTHPLAGIDLNVCLRASLRYTPTRICVGEVRGQEAGTVIEAWATGHRGGLLTMHAGDAIEALERLRRLSTRDGNIPSRDEIRKAVDVVIVVTKRPGKGRKVEMFRVVTGTERQFVCRPI